MMKEYPQITIAEIVKKTKIPRRTIERIIARLKNKKLIDREGADKDAQGYHKKEICVEDWSEDYYSSKLKELLDYYFDPYKEYGLEWCIRTSKEIGLVHDGELIVMSWIAREFLGIK